MAGYTPHHGTYLAHRITLEGRGEDAVAKSLSTARVETKPHQVDAALFALHSSLSKGAILADEVELAESVLPLWQSLKHNAPPSELEEERRNCFVGITRTKKQLVLTRAEQYRGYRKTPTRFLEEMGLNEQQEGEA